MNKVQFIAVLIGFALNFCAVVSQQFECPEAEEWTECSNPCNTCQQKGRCPESAFCRPGCDCQPGFYRNRQDQCIPEVQCEGDVSPQCPENAVFSKCGDACVGTCDAPRPQQCTDVPECTEGCFCTPGFLKRKDGKCVRPAQCRGDDEQKPSAQDTPQCPENAIYIKCGITCVPTCDEATPKGCNDKQQCIPGCFCMPGFLKRKDDTCVRPQNCTMPKASLRKEDPKCPPNAVYIECGSPCAPTCENPVPQSCNQDCLTACFCKPGLLKNKDGFCVAPQNCTMPEFRSERKIHRCPDNAHFQECATACPPTCENPETVSCRKPCVSACTCATGFLRRIDGKCVLPEACTTRITGRRISQDPTPAGQCLPNEELSSCKSACPATCSEPNPGNCTQKCEPGCVCKQGFIRNDKMDCISAAQCNQTCSLPEEEHLLCGPTCPDSCSKNSSLATDTTECPERCIEGCFCKKGLFRLKEGGCVRQDKCPTFLANVENSATTRGRVSSTSNNISTFTTTIPSEFGCPNIKECTNACRNTGLDFGECNGDKKEQCECFVFEK